MSDYHLLGLVLVPVIGIVVAIVIIFLCKSIDLCLPAGPGPYAHLANDAQERIRRSKRRREKQSEMERGAVGVAYTYTSGTGSSTAPSAPVWEAGAPVAAMAARAPMPPSGPVAPVMSPMRLLGTDQS